MSQSVVFQTYSETGAFGVDMAIIASSVVQVLRRQGVEAYVRNEGLEGLAWSEAHDVPEADETALETCEVLLRAWPAGSWPARPAGPRTVVDFVQRPADRSTQADYVIAFEDDGTTPFPGLIVWDVLFPLPVEVNDVAKEIIEDVVMIHLGQDPTSRLSGLQLAINGFAGMSALGLQYPGGAGGPGIIVTARPWDHLASGDIAIVTPEFPFRLAAAMRVPAVLVGSTAAEAARVAELVTRGHSSFLPLGLMSGLTNNQIRDAARDFRNDDTAQRVARLGGSEQRADQGVMRIASWVARELVGESVIANDPYNVQGFDTIIDPQTQVPVNAAAAVQEEGGSPTGEDEVADVQVFESDGVWTKPDGARYVEVWAIAAGGGGGSGRRGAAASVRGGGAGGLGGAMSFGAFQGETLPGSVAITVGVGGLGGVGQTVDDTNGNAGSSGSRSLFGSLLSAGPPATGLNAGGGTGAVGGSCAPAADNSYSDASGSPLTGGQGGAAFSAISGTVMNGYRSGAPGGGGGGITAANAINLAGDGGYSPARHALPPAGVAAGDDGGDGESSLLGEPFGGAAGAGGQADPADEGGMGGAGGKYGGAGGGGGASFNGFLSGAGGQGANGVVVVVTYF